MEAIIPVDTLIGKISEYNSRCNADLIREAYRFGQDSHSGQFRKSGEEYFTHPVAVSWILAEQQVDDTTIITSLLHDTIEDTKATHARVAELFGEEIAGLVDGVTKLTNLQLSSSESKQAENFRKLFMAMSRDLRVILVKLADRLHNMRTIRSMRPEKQAQKARETMEIYAPLAGRMGMQWMREELEDLAFRVLNPEARTSIMRRFLTLQKASGDVISKITDDIEKELVTANISAEISGRAKRPYSIWRKMQEKDQSFSRLSDIYGFRIITTSEAECYRVLGVVHQRWSAVPGRFKDYISQPKSNGYRSLHTTVSGRDGKRVEVQIRTKEMNEVAETGVAAHWSYRNGERVENRFAVDPVRWLAQLTERLDDDYDHDDFLEAVKLEMYQDQVFCFTPKGEVIKLPRGATPLDFAYAIHTRIGNRCVGAKVDGMRVPLWTRLKNGQSIEVITAEGQVPQVTWIDMAVTGRAKTSIRRALRQEVRSRLITQGREILRSAFENADKVFNDKALRSAAITYGLDGADDVLALVGSTDISGHDVLCTVFPDLAEKEGELLAPSQAIEGLQVDQHFDRASCCEPLPGERIVGISFRGKGLTVHAIDCDVLVEYEDQPKRWADLRWREGVHAPEYSVTLEITILNDAGVLGRVCSLIGEKEANISDLRFTDRKPDFYKLRVVVDFRDLEHLHQVLKILRVESNVSRVERVREKPSTKEQIENEAQVSV